MLSVSVIWCNIEAILIPNKIVFQNHEVPQKCKKSLSEQFYHTYFPPIDCSVIKTVRKTTNEILISNHKYLDNRTGDRLCKSHGIPD